MPRLSVFPTLVREAFASRTLPREPEPDLVMEGDEQVKAYEEAGSVDSVMSAAYLFHTARITQALVGAKAVVDLGCGPAVQLGQIAQFNPHIQFRGIDLSERMLAQGAQYLAEKGITNVSLERGDITQLSNVATASADAVISTMALHHLPRIELLRAAFAEIGRILKPGGCVYITDFGRLKSLKSVIFFAYQNEPVYPHLHLFWLDYERSLRAAFLPEEFGALMTAHLPPETKLFTTYGVPILNVIQTPPKALDASKRAEFRQRRAALPRRYRGDLDDMRLFLKMGGMKDDPFS